MLSGEYRDCSESNTFGNLLHLAVAAESLCLAACFPESKCAAPASERSASSTSSLLLEPRLPTYTGSRWRVSACRDWVCGSLGLRPRQGRHGDTQAGVVLAWVLGLNTSNTKRISLWLCSMWAFTFTSSIISRGVSQEQGSGPLSAGGYPVSPRSRWGWGQWSWVGCFSAP